MMTNEKWSDSPCFSGNASTVIIVTYTTSHPGPNFEFYIEAIGLDSYSVPANMRVYIWANRDSMNVQEDYEKIFEIGSVWRVSGQIEVEDNCIVFVDPVYMPYHGEACKSLKCFAATTQKTDDEFRGHNINF